MKVLFISLFVLLLAATAAQRPAAASYALNPTSSCLTWTGYAGAGTYAPSGTLRLAPGGLLATDGPTPRAARVLVDMRTLHHDIAKLQEHLQGADFFDVEHFPTATFELRQLASGQAEGQLTIKGQTHPIAIPLTITPLGADSLLLQGTAHIDRTQFGINYNSSSFFQNLGSYAIRNDFQLEFKLKAGRR